VSGWPGAALFYAAALIVGGLAFWELPTADPGTSLKRIGGALVLFGLGHLCRKHGSSSL
jgi:hypothetical protein